MFGSSETGVALEGERDTVLDAGTLQVPWVSSTLIPCVKFPSRLLAALHFVIQMQQSAGGDGGSFCNLRIELSEQWKV